MESDWDDLLKDLNISSTSNKLLNISKRINNLKKIYIFNNISEQKLIALSKLMKKERFGPDELIVKEGTIGDSFYLINRGCVRIFRNNTVHKWLITLIGNLNSIPEILKNDVIWQYAGSHCFSFSQLICYIS